MKTWCKGVKFDMEELKYKIQRLNRLAGLNKLVFANKNNINLKYLYF